MGKVIIYTDGSCFPNPGGPGGFGAVLMCGEKRREIKGGVKASTNNRMEMMAVIAALSALNGPANVSLYSDSQYVVNGTKWVFGWMQRGWRTKEGAQVKNQDLWKVILKLLNIHEVEMNWVKGHAGNPENERCDRLASEGAKLPGLPIDRGFIKQ